MAGIDTRIAVEERYDDAHSPHELNTWKAQRVEQLGVSIFDRCLTHGCDAQVLDMLEEREALQS